MNVIVRISVSVVLIMILEAPLELLRKISLALKEQSTQRSHHNSLINKFTFFNIV